MICFVMMGMTFLAAARAGDSNPPPAPFGGGGGGKFDILIEGGVIYYPGGGGNKPATLGPVIEHIFRARYPQASFVVAPDLTNVPVADLKLAHLAATEGANEISTALQAVRLATGNAFSVTTSPNSGVYFLNASQRAPALKRTVAAFNVSRLGRDSGALAADLQRTSMDLDMRRSEFGEQNPQVKQMQMQVKFLQEELQQDFQVKEERVNMAREQVLKTLATLHLPGSPEFDYNPNMKLLVVVGTEDQLEVTRTILNALLDTPPSPRTNAPPLRMDLLPQ